MDDAYRFAPAAPEEDIVHGASSPGWHTAAPHETAVGEWLSFMQSQGIERVCCLLSGRHLDSREGNIARYRRVFGTDAVLHAPVPDHHLADPAVLRETVLPFLDAADTAGEPVLVHSLAGLGRTGHVLAAWLVYGREYDPEDAIETVSEMGRAPLDPVERGNATRAELIEALSSP